MLWHNESNTYFLTLHADALDRGNHMRAVLVEICWPGNILCLTYLFEMLSLPPSRRADRLVPGRKATHLLF